MASRTIPPSDKTWSSYQLAIFNDTAEGEGHTVVRARAGTGKTTVICRALWHVPAGLSVLVLAFNNKIKDELVARQRKGDLPPGVDIMTCHGFGFSACKNAFRSQLSDNRTWALIEVEHGDRRDEQDFRAALAKAVGFAKATLARTAEDIAGMLGDMLDRGQLDEVWSDLGRFVGDVAQILELCRKNPKLIDFDDMCWLPVDLGLRVRQYDRVFVDETQDLNAAQIKLALAACKPGGRICAVGDDRQAIYGFRGADAEALPRVVCALDAHVLPLSVTYRCAQAIVDEARTVVDDYEAAPNAPAGEKRRIDVDAARSMARPGDFVISRKNAPLMGLCLGFIRAGLPATVAGRDVGAGLRALVDKSKARTVPALAEWLDTWREREIARIMKRKSKPGASDVLIDIAADKVECINALADGAGSIAEIRSRIDALFVDKDDERRIVCTTVHKAKGLERKRAFVLVDTFAVARGVEEANLYYVAVTRAKDALFLVSQPNP